MNVLLELFEGLSNTILLLFQFLEIKALRNLEHMEKFIKLL